MCAGVLCGAVLAVLARYTLGRGGPGGAGPGGAGATPPTPPPDHVLALAVYLLYTAVRTQPDLNAVTDTLHYLRTLYYGI